MLIESGFKEITPHTNYLIFILEANKRELKVYIETCELWEIVNSGKRKSKDPSIFQDVIKNLKEWLRLPTTMTGRIGPNQETAYNKWFACNED